MAKHPKRPRDPNQLGKLIVDLSIGDVKESKPVKDSPATEFARQKGGKAREEKLTSERRYEIAAHAAQRRWERKRGDG